MADLTKTKLDLIATPPVQTRHTESEIEAMLRVARGDNYAVGVPGGPEGDKFEKAFVEMMGCTDAVSVNTCSSALELAAVLSGLGPEDEVIIPAHTFVATAVPMGRTGATIRWADIDPGTRVVSADSVQSLVNDRTRVLVVVHLYGLPADMPALMTLAETHGLTVIEDCAQANGASINGQRVGSFGDFGCFSFQGNKNMTTLGEGGMLTVRNAEHGTQARRARWMGNWVFESEREKDWIPAGGNLVQPVPGRWPLNTCMPEVIASVGREVLKRVDDINAQRLHQAKRFMEQLADYPELVFQHVPEGYVHAYHLMSARYDGVAYGRSNDDLITLLRDGYAVKAIVQYWPLYRSELFREFGFGEADVPETDRFYDNMVSFPWWSDMSDAIIDEMGRRTRAALDALRKADG